MTPVALIPLWNQIAAAWLASAAWGLFTVLAISCLCALAGHLLSATLRCWLWWLVCARLAFVVVTGFASLAGLSLSYPIPLHLPEIGRLHAMSPAAPPAFGAGDTANPVLQDTVGGSQNAVTTMGIQNPVPRPTFAAYLLLFWGIGVLVSLALVSRDARRLRFLLRAASDISATSLAEEMREIAAHMGVGAPPRLVESAATSSPFVAGLRNPVLVVPVGFSQSVSAEEARMALAHELAHLRRGDLYLALIPLAARILCFCIPLVPTWACREWATAREADCDARAMNATAASPGVYSRLLIKIVRGDAAPVPAMLTTLGATASFHTLHTRLQLIRDRPEARTMATGWVALFCLLALGVAIPWHLASASPVKSSSRPLASLTPLPVEKGTEDIADVPAFTTYAGADPNKKYLLIGATAGNTPPPQGYRLLVVLPGGDGSSEFNYFVRRLRKRALGEGYVVAELVAKRWDKQQFDEVVWPTQTNPWPAMRFTTEEFIAAVVQDVQARLPIDRRHIFTLTWASSGPAGYAASLEPGSPITGSFIAMSIFATDILPPLSRASGHPYFILHPERAPIIPVAVAKRAENLLRRNGATVQLITYPGGYVWSGDVYAQVRRGVRYLEEQTAR